MSFAARTRAQIREDIIASLRARYTAAGRTLDVSERSDAYLRADALAVVLAPIEQQAALQVRDTFIDTASDEAVARFASQFGIAARPASAARLLVELTGIADTRTSPTGALSFNGALFDALDAEIVLDGSGVGYIAAQAREAGSAGNLATGDELVWTEGAPSGLAAAAAVAGTVAAGEDAESIASLRARVLARIRQRVASGNAEEWRSNVEDCDNVDAAFVYPLLEPPGVSGETLGCVSVVALGPPQGDRPSNTRIIASERTAEIKAYIEGTMDVHGAPSPGGTPLYPASMSASDFDVFNAGETTLDVALQVKTGHPHAFAFSGSLTITGVPTATEIQVVGDHASKTGKRVLVRVGTSLIRGAWQVTTLESGAYDGVSKTTFRVSLLGAPDLADVYPAPSNWEAIRLAVFALFDSLGPRDTTPARRWPTVDVSHPDTVYRSALQMALLRLRGIVSASVVLPATDFVPTNAKQLATLDTLLVTEAP